MEARLGEAVFGQLAIDKGAVRKHYRIAGVLHPISNRACSVTDDDNATAAVHSRLNADVGVVVAVATEIIPPVNPTEVTVPFPLKVDQSAADKAPRLVADAVGTFNVITGVVVLVATLDDKSVPVVPNVKAETEVTVPVVGVAHDGIPAAKVNTCPFVATGKNVVVFNAD